MTSGRFRHLRPRWLLLFALVALGRPLAAADVAKLAPGVELPLLESKTLNGETAALPRDARGHAAVLVFGFSKASSKVTRPWLEGCLAATKGMPAGSEVYCYDLRMVEDVPRMFRGSMEHGMQSGYPAELQRRALVVYSENDAWRQRLGVADTKTAYVVGCDAEGRVRGTATGPFQEEELKKLLAAPDPVAPAR